MTDVTDRIKKRGRTIRIVAVILVVPLLLCVAVGLYMLMLWKNGDRLDRDTMFVPKQPGAVTMAEAEVTPTPTASIEADTPDASAAETIVPATGTDGPTVRYNDKYYKLNEDVFSVLFIGVDTDDESQFESIGVTAHQADTLILAAVDPERNAITMINIPRMTITDVKQLDPAFNYARTTRSPICIQYAFGDGKELSCDLTREAVSNLLFGIPVSRYVAMNLDGLYKANDAIGGVTLTIMDDMTSMNPAMKKGETYTLTGRDAEIYVSGRMGKGLDGTNMSRTRRQIQYYKAFFSTAKEKLKADPMFALNLYNSMGASVQTDMSVEEIIYLSKHVIYMDIGDENIYTIEGTVKNEDFFADDDALKELLIKVFYLEVDD